MQTTQPPKTITRFELDQIPNIHLLDQAKSLDEAKQWFLDHEHLEIHHHHHWLLKQLVAKFQQWQLVVENGMVQAKATLHKNLQDPKQRRYYWLQQVPRSLLLKKQCEYPQYAQLTPLILLAHKQEYNYTKWQGLECLEPWLRTALQDSAAWREVYLELRSHHEQLQQWYHRSLNGKPAKSQAKVYRCPEIPLNSNTKVLLLQHWLASVTIRHQDQILDPLDWSNIPEPIVVCEPLASTNRTKPKLTQPKPWLPWD